MDSQQYKMQLKSKFSRRFRKDDEHMGKHINLFETKTKEELLELYKEFLEVEKKAAISDDSELGKIKTEYEKDFGANTVLMLQIELTHAISDMWYKENIKQPIDLDFYVVPLILVDTLNAVEGAGLNVRPTNEQLQLNSKANAKHLENIYPDAFLLEVYHQKGRVEYVL